MVAKSNLKLNYMNHVFIFEQGLTPEKMTIYLKDSIWYRHTHTRARASFFGHRSLDYIPKGEILYVYEIMCIYVCTCNVYTHTVIGPDTKVLIYLTILYSL